MTYIFNQIEVLDVLEIHHLFDHKTFIIILNEILYIIFEIF